MLLFVDRPDRIHAEILTPVGSTVWIFDTGGGRLAMTDVRHGEAWVGADDGSMLARWIGVRLSGTAWIAAVLDGTVPEGWTIERQGEAGSSLPRQLVVADGRTRLALDLRRLRPVAGDPALLGRGSPPDGVIVHPLDSFDEGRVEDP